MNWRAKIVGKNQKCIKKFVGNTKGKKSFGKSTRRLGVE
jgi:hypothetical protein